MKTHSLRSASVRVIDGYARNVGGHGFKERKMSALRIRIDETWGEPSARVYEV